MKKTVSRQNTNDSTRVHGMYGSMHTDIFEGMSLRGINLSTDDREKNHEVRSNKRKNTGRKALTRAIAAESPLSMGYAVELERFGRGLGAGVKRSGTASAEALRRSASRYRTKAEEAGTSLRALGKLFSIRNLILMLFAALTISAALILMLFNFEKAVVYGNTMYDQKQIEHFITQGRLGENTFVMALKYHNRTVEGLPFVDRIDIDIVSPSTVRVNITEKPLDARVSYGETEVYLSKEGIIQTVSYRTNENTTVVKGLQVVDPETGTRVEAKNQTGLDNTLKLLNVMDRYDPDKKVAMAVDEWGLWVDNEPGTPLGHLFQQNTMRSALCAALMLHIFHRHADRIRIANLAQTINVLQSILLTEGATLVKTPTYHVFDLFKGHQDGEYVPAAWERAPEAIQKGLAQADISASVKDGALTVSLVNLSAEKEADVALALPASKPVSATGRVLCGRPSDHNTFDAPDRVRTSELPVALDGEGVRVTLPPCGIASLEIRLG